MRTSLLLFILLISSIIPLSLYAQEGEGFEHLSPIAHGAGRTYVVTSRGLAAVGLNPALLGYENGNTLEVQIFPISSFGLDAGPGFSDAKALGDVFNFGGGRIDSAKSRQITDLLSNGKLSGRGDAEVLGIAYTLPETGTFAFTWTTHAGLRTDIPQSFLDFFNNAESRLLQSPNAIDNFDLQGMWYNEYAVSFGKTLKIGKDTTEFLKDISVGGAIKYVSGIAYLRVNDGNYIHTEPRGGRVLISANFDEFSAYSSNFDPAHIPNRFSFNFITSNSAGSGIAADIGVAIGLFSNKVGTPTVLLGLSATDIGSISWNNNATERIADHLFDSIVYQNATKIQDITDSLKKFAGTLRHIPSFTTGLPSMFRAGLQIDLDAMGIEWGVFAPKIAIEYANGLTSLVGSLKNGRLGAGLTLERTGTIGLRLAGGFIIEQGANDITLGVGATFFRFLNIDLASAHVGQFFKSGASRTDVALAVRAAF